MARPQNTGDLSATARIAEYKRILSQILEQRPSGTRQRLADALGKHRSFITQIAGPTYPTPIPAPHLPVIFNVCHFNPAERDAFLAAYNAAHPRKLAAVPGPRRNRQLSIAVPDLGDEQRNAALDRAIQDFVQRVAGLAAAKE